MKVFVINVVCAQGSTGRVVEDIYHLLVKKGHQCRVAYSRGELQQNMDVLKIGSRTDLYGHALLSRITDRQGFYSKRATRKLIEEIRNYEPDVIHLHNLHGYYLNMELLFDFLRDYQRPVIWTLHDCYSFTGHCVHFSKVQCDRWKSGCYQCPQKKEYPASMLLDNAKRNWLEKKRCSSGLNLTIVTVSKWLQSLVEQSFLGNYEVKTIYNGLDLTKFLPTESDFRQKYGIQDKYMILGVANRWMESKGFNDFLQLADMLSDKYVIVLVGVTREHQKVLKENMIGISNISDSRKLAGIYSTADVYVNASVEETFGMTTLEAIACGTPAIAYGITGISESLADLPQFIAKPGDIEQVKVLIEKVCKEGIAQERLLRTASKYDKWERFDEYLNLYEEKLKKV